MTATTITGFFAVRGSPFKLDKMSQPLMGSMTISNVMAAGCNSAAVSTARSGWLHMATL
jgi:hypothetical protein